MVEPRPLVDAGPLVAIVSEDDANHGACIAALTSLRPPLLSCWPVLTEAAWLLRRRPAALRRLLGLCDGSLVSLLDLDSAALGRVSEILRRYESIGAQLADASLIYLAEREGIRTIFTLDRRDFTVYRLKGNRALNLLP